jgi:hypothetical protein
MDWAGYEELFCCRGDELSVSTEPYINLNKYLRYNYLHCIESLNCKSFDSHSVDVSSASGRACTDFVWFTAVLEKKLWDMASKRPCPWIFLLTVDTTRYSIFC